jgi:hypothetical protein
VKKPLPFFHQREGDGGWVNSNSGRRRIILEIKTNKKGALQPLFIMK